MLVREARIGPYRLLELLGEGGMGRVYLATSPSGEQVVVKVPLGDAPKIAQRMRDEARAGFRVRHPALVETRDLVEDGGVPALVVSYVQGASFAELLKSERRPLSESTVARLGSRLAEALGVLHRATDQAGMPLGIVHRDVTVSNVLIDTTGAPVLIDLGIARSNEAEAVTTQLSIKGTLRFLAPELFEGLAATPASDIWSLGCVLLEAVTGRPCFVGSQAEIIAAVLLQDVAERPEVQALTPDFRAILLQMLRRRPEERLADGFDLAKRLESLGYDTADDRQQLRDRVCRVVEQRTRQPVEDRWVPPRTAVGSPPEPDSPRDDPVASAPNDSDGLFDAMTTVSMPLDHDASAYIPAWAASGSEPDAVPQVTRSNSGLFLARQLAPAPAPEPHTPPSPQPSSPPPTATVSTAKLTTTPALVASGATDSLSAEPGNTPATRRPTARRATLDLQAAPTNFPDISGRQQASKGRPSGARQLVPATPWMIGMLAAAGLASATLWWRAPAKSTPSDVPVEARLAVENGEQSRERRPACWRTDEGYKFVYEEGGREIHVDRIAEVPAHLRPGARCELDLRRPAAGAFEHGERPSCWRGDVGYFFSYTTDDGSEVVVQRLTDVPLGRRKKARCIKTSL